MTNFASDFVNRMNGRAPAPQSPVAVLSADQELQLKISILVNQLKTDHYVIEYKKKDGTITEMEITLDPRFANYDPDRLRDQLLELQKLGQLTVWSPDRNGWRHIIYKNIQSIAVKAGKPEPKAPASAIVDLTEVQQKLLMTWLTSVVGRTLALTGKSSDVSLTFNVSANGALKIVEKNSGLSIDL